MGNKYDWSAAPDWASWAATDSSGAKYWYESEPYLKRQEWRDGAGRVARIEPTGPRCEDSLERRP